MDISAVINLYNVLEENEVLRIELINRSKIYCLPKDKLDTHAETNTLNLLKPLNGVNQRIIIDGNSIVVICTMSRQTYDLKLQRGELYV
mgnify:CR=1 FL=1